MKKRPNQSHGNSPHTPKTDRKLNSMNPYSSLLLALCACLFIFIGCGSMDENQPGDNGLIILTEPLEITGANVLDGAKDIDPELLNTAGIQITFDSNIKGGTVELKPEDGAPLNWIAEWGRNSVWLFPRNADRLQNGTEYIIELIVNDGFGEYDFEIRFTTKE